MVETPEGIHAPQNLEYLREINHQAALYLNWKMPRTLKWLQDYPLCKGNRKAFLFTEV